MRQVKLIGDAFDGSYVDLPDEADSFDLRDPDVKSKRWYCYKPTGEVDAEGVEVWRCSTPPNTNTPGQAGA
jgi:hypothetical protein